MAGYQPGKSTKIVRWLPDEAKQRGGRWYMRAELACGHIEDVCVGNSPSHRRPGSKQAILSGRCMVCWKKENKL